MLESGSSGSVRGASSNGRPYREPRSTATQTFFKPTTSALGGKRACAGRLGKDRGRCQSRLSIPRAL
jgi:hypothetical protein